MYSHPQYPQYHHPAQPHPPSLYHPPPLHQSHQHPLIQSRLPTNIMPPPVKIPPTSQISSNNHPTPASNNSSSKQPSPINSEIMDEMNVQATAPRPPPPTSKIWQGRAWGIRFEQQPARARMCGFGDKVDLFSIDGLEEKNLVKHTSSSPSISSSSAMAYPQTCDVSGNGGMPAVQTALNFNIHSMPGYNNTYGPPQRPQPYGNGSSNGHTNGYPQNGYMGSQYQDERYPPDYHNGEDERARTMASASTASMFSRNLIGTTCASAFKLKDPEDKSGLWFILQDLSVRTEGYFRLRAYFVNISEAVHHPASSYSYRNPTSSNAPVLATCYSDVFKVYSAKKFPGVVESTLISRTFAAQGIKIPIRKGDAAAAAANGNAEADGKTGTGSKRKAEDGEEEDEDENPEDED